MNASCGISEPTEFACLAKLIGVFDRIAKSNSNQRQKKAEVRAMPRTWTSSS